MRTVTVLVAMNVRCVVTRAKMAMKESKNQVGARSKIYIIGESLGRVTGVFPLGCVALPLLEVSLSVVGGKSGSVSAFVVAWSGPSQPRAGVLSWFVLSDCFNYIIVRVVTR